ncbi:MAG: hypothetical protein HQK97_06280 [Nitrospirae bacterium]|nr:hypothetical protein [Nitrospirota bacterium]
MTYIANRKFKLKTPSGIENLCAGDMFLLTNETAIQPLIAGGYVSIIKQSNVEPVQRITTTEAVEICQRTSTASTCTERQERYYPGLDHMDYICNKTGRLCQYGSGDFFDDYMERAAIMEFDGGLDRADAEREAYEFIKTKYGYETRKN